MPKATAAWYGTLFFKAPSGAGWSEGYYLKASIADPTSADTQINAVATARRALLTNVFTQVSQRLSRLDLLRDVSSIIPFASQPGTFNPTGSPFDFTGPGDGLLFRSLATGGYTTTRLLRCIPEATLLNGVYTVDTGVEPGATWNTKITAFFAALTSNTTGCFYERLAPPAPPPVPRPILKPDWFSHAVQRAAVKKAGRPFGLSRGRSA